MEENKVTDNTIENVNITDMVTEEGSKKEKRKKEKKPRTKWKDLPAEVRKKKRKRYIWISIAVAVVVFFAANSAMGAGAKLPVNTAVVARNDVEAVVTTSGKVESDKTRTYYTEITGNIGDVLIKQGQAVKSGDVLLHFSDETLKIADKEAQAAALTSDSAYANEMNQNSKKQGELNEATHNLDVLKQQIEDHKAFIKDQERELEDLKNKRKASLSAWGMELSKEMAELDPKDDDYEEDYEELQEEQAEYQYSLETFDMSRDFIEKQRAIDDHKERLAEFESYEAEMKSQKSSTEDVVLSKDQKEAKEVSNEAQQLKNAQAVDYYNAVAGGLKADMDGVVTQLNVTAGAPVADGAALVTIASNSKVHVTINLSKADLTKVQEGQSVDVTIAGKKYEGEVSFINRVAEVNANNMPVVKAQIAITNADEDIYLGIEAKVVIHAQKAEGVLTVPVETVNADKDGDFVYVVENGIVVRKDIVTGVSSDTDIEIVSGLNEGDQVLTEVTIGITEGMEVESMTALSEDGTVIDPTSTDVSISIEGE